MEIVISIANTLTCKGLKDLKRKETKAPSYRDNVYCSFT